LALIPFDRPLSTRLQDRSRADEDIGDAAKSLAFLGGPGPFVVGGVLLLGGVASGQAPIESAGRRVTESVTIAAVTAAIGKGLFGRALPGVQARHGFSFGRGFHDNNGPFVSFPSGHTAAGFALATAVSEEAKACNPAAARFVVPASYSIATLIAAARVYQHVHWPSDIPVGAAIGYLSGKFVEDRAHHGRQMTTTRRAIDGLTVVPRSATTLTIAWSSMLVP
jgi:membrane-associated phospholipid phosphatase